MICRWARGESKEAYPLEVFEVLGVCIILVARYSFCCLLRVLMFAAVDFLVDDCMYPPPPSTSLFFLENIIVFMVFS